ncbi:PQQ-dependent sugar dehydrogenase, partial [Aquidulcibacter sp.]|uniref:PQQ-dependent sugar dehydrogenase n=1 Tax=Aquidulcibacter sp. TaxID=2052990 RepID=UPI0028B0A373
MMVRKASLALAGLALLAANVAVPAVAQAQTSSPMTIVPGPTPVTKALGLPAAVSVTPQTMVADLEAPWGLAFLPNGDLLVTELLGKLRYVKAGTNWSLEAKEIKGVPTVTAAGQGGLMDVTLHPSFSRNKLIYLSFSVGDEAENRTRIVRAKLEGRALTD